MTVVLNIALLSLAVLSVLAALYFVMKGMGARSSINRQAYSVGQVEARRSSLVHWVRAAFFLLVGLIFLGIFAVRPLLSGRGATTEPTPPPPTLPAQVTPTAPSAPVVQPTTAPALPSPTSPPVSPTPQATAAPTGTPAPQTATVSSGVGVWLRGAPSTSGEQLEWLLDGTVVTLLAGQQTADDLLWQQVQTQTGVEGWVARDFLTVQE
ncbi:SH3 domain-containing protein [Promineifilum sp.]|uniref:SH3 domain-containing protein n=1 Tax=Promineifilum sp. TaxID=2664178 RepID=UPI0035B2F643